MPWHPTLGDVDSPQALAEYQEAKRIHKEEWAKAGRPQARLANELSRASSHDQRHRYRDSNPGFRTENPSKIVR